LFTRLRLGILGLSFRDQLHYSAQLALVFIEVG
jgi:hypothetical protein